VAVAGGIALVRLTGSSSRAVRVAVTALVLVAIVADSWTFTLPMPSVPPLVQLPDAVPESAAVLELPLGNVGSDIAAVYRSIGHRRPVVNGYSGYEPPHYRVLRTGLGERDDSVLTTLTRFAPLAVVIAREDDPGGGWSAFVAQHAEAVRLEETERRSVYFLPAAPPESRGGGFEASLPIRTVSFNLGPLDPHVVTDADGQTVWATPMPQRGGEEILIELEQLRAVSGVSVSTGPPLEGYPRALLVSTSRDGDAWEDVWSGAMGGLALEAVISDPRAVESRIGFAAREARFVRVRQMGAHPDFGWFVAELKVYGSASP
jgi:hypothetical protein